MILTEMYWSRQYVTPTIFMLGKKGGAHNFHARKKVFHFFISVDKKLTPIIFMLDKKELYSFDAR